jgi:uncharacterized protein involved in exopolysaccharide biosynthesis
MEKHIQDWLVGILKGYHNHLHYRMDQIMSALDDLKATEATVKADVALLVDGFKSVSTNVEALKAQVADLTAKLAAGGTVSEADLNALTADLKSVDATIKVVLPPVA